jgi:hypothetical protein
MLIPAKRFCSLSASLEADFVSNGSATLRGLLNGEAVQQTHDWLGAVLKLGRAIPTSFDAEFEAHTDAVRKIRRLYWNDEKFWARIFKDNFIPDLAQQLIGTPVALTFHAAFLKPPEIGTEVVLHQDQTLWKHDYPNAISVWVAITSATRQNGCLIGCPGSHKRGAIRHSRIDSYGWHPGIDWREEDLPEPLSYELEPGDALVWNRYFVHGSGPNLSTQPRWGIVMVFVDRSPAHLRTTDRIDF